MKQSFLYFILIILVSVGLYSHLNRCSFTTYLSPFASSPHDKWWLHDNVDKYGYPSLSHVENFENHLSRPSTLVPEVSPLLEFPPNTPDSADIYNEQPYHLLGDIYPPPRSTEHISDVTSRSCYATDFNRLISKTGTYRQLTNNYKRSYPDSCSSPYQELVLNFYKASPMTVPKNDTGRTVSEA